MQYSPAASGFSHSAQCLHGSSVLQHVSEFPSFSWPHNIPMQVDIKKRLLNPEGEGEGGTT